MLRTRIKTWLLWLFIGGVALAAPLAFDEQQEASSGIDISSTASQQTCLSFAGHGTDEQGNLYILGTDGERYDMPKGDIAAENVPEKAETQLESTMARRIEQKFCLPEGQIEVDIQNGKFVNITWYNR